MYSGSFPALRSLAVRVQQKPFDVGAELALLSESRSVGAIASFVGTVRDYGDRQNVVALQLEHYPGMTAQSLCDILQQASARWPIAVATVVHRVGHLSLGEQVVLVAVAAGHRHDAFSACEFVMDWLKTEAPFWKREITSDGPAHWGGAKASDEQASRRWSNSDSYQVELLSKGEQR